MLVWTNGSRLHYGMAQGVQTTYRVTTYDRLLDRPSGGGSRFESSTITHSIFHVLSSSHTNSSRRSSTRSTYAHKHHCHSTSINPSSNNDHRRRSTSLIIAYDQLAQHIQDGTSRFSVARAFQNTQCVCRTYGAPRSCNVKRHSQEGTQSHLRTSELS